MNHHSDTTPSKADQKQGDDLADEIGDLFIESSAAPTHQWAEVVKALRLHNYRIVDDLGRD